MYGINLPHSAVIWHGEAVILQRFSKETAALLVNYQQISI